MTAQTTITEPIFGRVATAMITPFDDNGVVDYDQLARVSNYLVDNGTDTLVVAGTTGESATLTVDEKLRLFKSVKEAVGSRAKVLAGTGSYSTADAIVLSREAEHIGVDGLLIVTPYYNRPSQEGMYQHYKSIAAVTSIPIMLYNVPGRTGVNLEASTVLRLAELDGIVCVKEASKNLEQVGEILAGAPAGFQVYSGDDAVTLPILALGGVGVVSVISHVVGPDLQKMHQAYFAGDLETARRIHLGTLKMTRAMFSFPSPSPTKTALEMLNVLPNSVVRQPLMEASDQERAVVHAALQQYGLLNS